MPRSGWPAGAAQIEVVDPLWITLSDGARLCARMWRPRTAESEPVPAILEYLPYRKDDVHAREDSTIHPYYAAAGYAAIRVDMRGSGDSDGVLTDEYSAQEHADTLEVIDWISRQPWCTGNVGMTGISWSGFNSLQIAALRPPALKAIITACSTDDRYDNDVHYLGGVPLACYLLPWASALMSFNVRAPDPAIVGERWRELWMTRLQGSVDLAELWLSHQARDDYWRHGSICEDYAALECAVLAVGGWADAYVDAILRMLERLQCPRRGLIGPWGHQWPQYGHPGPQIGFLQEAVRWWDHWLKGADNGAMDGPMLRAWMPDAVRPAPDYVDRPGRWIAEPALPAQSTTPLRLALSGDGRLAAAGDARPADATPLAHCSGQTVGLDAGAWCAYALPGDMPLDQRRDDAQSLSLDSDPLQRAIEIFGNVTVSLRVSADRPSAFVVARLCDVWPDGASTLIARGVLNLCHREGRDRPLALTPGEPVDAIVPMKATAYAVPAGHRLRLSISTSYWPWLWPSPAPATITVATGGDSVVEIPVRAPQPGDAALPEFGPAEQAPPLQTTWLRHPDPGIALTFNPGTGETGCEIRRDFAAGQRFPSGLEYRDHDPATLTIRDGDPLSSVVRVHRRIEQSRDDWRVRVELRSQMTADATDYLLSTAIDAYEGDTRVHSRTFTSRVPRNHS
ncbi:MAG TPA: CocE/NonD family hydrolase [Solirubrobacteraceae bacterium]|nr:CocE/NonD family hydrolase [Solirubrobacteraceae bacterium]